MTFYIMCVIGLYVFGSLFYVYRFHGNVRYSSFGEYIRKGWPIFSPFNCALYIFTKPFAKRAVIKETDAPEYFESFKVLQDNWEVMQKEALKLREEGHFDAVSCKDSKSYYDLGFRTFYKYGWSKFYLHWYGQTLNSAQRMCPETVEVLKKCPAVKGAMFSILPSGSKLTRHLDPVASSLRYHLALETPHDEKCFINVNGEDLLWKNGEHFVFDETYLHYAKNDTDQDRIILLCDVERPMGVLGKLFNLVYVQFLKLSVVPNTSEDQRGLINRIFSILSPVLSASKTLKDKNLFLYKCLKYTVNATLFALIAFILYCLFQFLFA